LITHHWSVSGQVSDQFGWCIVLCWQIVSLMQTDTAVCGPRTPADNVLTRSPARSTHH